MADFVHLHVHSDFSMLDGLSKIPKLIEKVKQHGQKAIALTDHGGMYGAVQFYNACKKAGIKPIIGVEAYMAKESRRDKQTRMGGDQFHLTLLAQNFTGYQNLMQLVSLANFEGFSYKPRVDFESLQKYQEGVIVLSGCMNSLFSKLLRDGKEEEALEWFKKFKKTFPGRFYVEIQNHPTIEELKSLTKKQVAVARKLDLPIVATNDVHYVEKDEARAQDALLCVQTRKLISDKNRMSMLNSPSFYLKSTDEMVELFADYPEAIENTVKLAESVDLTIPTGQLIFPSFEIPDGKTDAEYLHEITYKKAKEKFGKLSKEVRERLDYELEIINTKGFANYFLITQDFVNWAKESKIGVGPGRGSVAGSLVSYVTGITTINPLEHGLAFERFLNPERPTPPDIDMDFADDRRDEVIDYVADKYGEDRVAHVITFGKMEARVAIRDIGRVLGMPYNEPDRIAKLIPNHPQQKTTLEKAVNTVPELKEYYQQPKYKKLIDLAMKVEGSIRHSSVHAAAIIITDKSLPNYTPIEKDSRSGKTITQYDMYVLDCNISDDAIGLLKFDFLGLRNLTIIQTAIKLIEEYKKEKIDVGTIPLDDKKTFELLSSGDTMGVFQLESAGMRRVARSLKPNQFSDITAMVALYRPGPMDLIPTFIEGKHNPDKITYPHKSLVKVLEETYGVMVYQEQVMEIANVMAGYSPGEADILRRAIGKKKKKLLDENKKRFIEQAVKKGYTQQVSEKVWGFIEAFANYGFNKAHAASYAMIAYQTAYLKANYPVEYMTALMSVESASSSASRDTKVAVSIDACKQMGILVLPPDVNHSEADFTIEKNKESYQGLAIRFGFNAIKHVGSAAIENILATRKKLKGNFSSLTQLIHETDGRKVNKTTLDCLIKVGAMDQFGTRASMLENLESIRQTASKLQSDVDGQDTLFMDVTDQTTLQDSFPILPEYPNQELLSFEKELLGLYLTDHPMGKALITVAKQSNKNIGELDHTIHQGSMFIFGGILSNIREITTKNGKQMAFATLEDQTGSIRLVTFPKIYEQYQELFVDSQVVLIKGKVEYRDEELQLIVEKMSSPDLDLISKTDESDYQEIFIPRKTSKDTLKELGALLKSNPGEKGVVVLIPNGAEPQRMTLPYKVKWSKDLEKSIQKLLK